MRSTPPPRPSPARSSTWCHYPQWKDRDVLVATYERVVLGSGLVGRNVSGIFRYLDRTRFSRVGNEPLQTAVPRAMQSALDRWQPSPHAEACRARALARLNIVLDDWVHHTNAPGGKGYERAMDSFKQASSRQNLSPMLD